jgi:hypothetical protein
LTTRQHPTAPPLTAFSIPVQEEKQKIQNDLRILTERLSRINDSLARKVASRNEYDKTIMETEAAYMKILESSQVQLPTPPFLPSRAAFALAFHPSIPTSIHTHQSSEGWLVHTFTRCSFSVTTPHPLLCKHITLGHLYLFDLILPHWQTLLHVLKRESVSLTKKQSASSGQ